MRRADRLFEIVQILRRRKLVRARDLAEKLEVSERTIYRDVQDLMASGVPVDGEAGVGYILRRGFDLPPLMFNEQELEALVLGARIVQSWTDAKLADAAGNALSKIEAVVPERLQQFMDTTALFAPGRHASEPISVDMAELRRAVRSRLKLAFAYQDAAGEPTHRTVRPLLISFFGPIWTMTAWCELRQDFRTFRLDRIVDLSVTGEVFRPEPGRTLADCLQSIG
jgi:predicted DNA-binding transcriptional regulator YafY